MLVHVKLFAAARQQVGRDTVDVDLPAGATVAELRKALSASLPQLASLLHHAMFAVGVDYAAESTVLSPSADVACIPPVSGG